MNDHKNNKSSSVENLAVDSAYRDYQHRRINNWNKISDQDGKGLGGYYHRRLVEVYRQVIPPGQRLLEIGCSKGDLLAALAPSFGVGIDFSRKMIDLAKRNYPQLNFVLGDAHELCFSGIQFDVIILSDLLNDSWDIQTIFENLVTVSHPGTRIVINTYSRLWELPLALAEKMSLARPVLHQNWLTVDDLCNLMNVSGFEMIRSWQEILFPLQIPILSNLCNRFIVKIWPFTQLALTNFLIARPYLTHSDDNPSVSICIPARNEAGNIERIFNSLPDLGCETEVIFVEGNSRDDTFEAIQHFITQNPKINAVALRQNGTGKGDAVRLGFDRSHGDILMILDADLTVPPSYLPRFYDAIRCGKGEFINGVRLVYPMEKQAMQFLNLVGNKLFSLLFTWLIGQPVKDTLCGTKVIWRDDYRRIAQNRTYFGDFDPFGDFDLLFGAARLGLKIVDLPIRYRDRTYGTTNISRWKHGFLLLRMALVAAKRLKFV